MSEKKIDEEKKINSKNQVTENNKEEETKKRSGSVRLKKVPKELEETNEGLRARAESSRKPVTKRDNEKKGDEKDVTKKSVTKRDTEKGDEKDVTKEKDVIKGDTERKGDTEKKGDDEKDVTKSPKKSTPENKTSSEEIMGSKSTRRHEEDKSPVKSPRKSSIAENGPRSARSISIPKSPTKKTNKTTDLDPPGTKKAGGLLASAKKGGVQKNATIGSDNRKASRSLQSSASNKTPGSWKNDYINIQISKEVATWLISHYKGSPNTDLNDDPTSTEEYNKSNWSTIISSVANREDYTMAVSTLPTRTKIVEEMVMTERTYVQSLQQVVKNFINPLRINQILPEIECEALFSVIEIIIDLNKVFLKKLEEGFKQWPRLQNIGQIFKDNVPLFKCYYRYIRRYNTIITRITTLHEENPKFKEFCIDQGTHIQGSLTLNALLIMPVQRLPRYELLLRELIKNTPEGHSDIPSLQKAFECIREVNEYINTRSKKDEEKDFILDVLEVQRKLKGVKGVVGVDTVGFLMIKINEGRKLPAMDKNGKSDPYCLILYKDNPKLKTKIIFKTLNPKWEEHFILEIPKNHDPSEKILIQCLDHDQAIVDEDDDMGYLSFPLGDFFKEPRVKGWWKLKSPLEMEEGMRLGKKKKFESKRWEEKMKEWENMEGEIFIEFVYRAREEKEDE